MDNSISSKSKIGLFSATIICMNAMIGAGIFTAPAKIATTTGPAAILTYLFVIIAVLLIALSYMRVVKLYPGQGSFYLYAKQWGGHIGGLMAVGAYIIGILFVCSLLAQLAGSYLNAFFPYLSAKIIGILLLFLISTLNAAGVKIVQTGQIVLLACTLFALFSTIILGFFNANLANLTPFMPYGVSSLAAILSTALFAFFGFESAASLYAFVKDPETNVPKALIISLSVVAAIYLAFIISIILAIPLNIFTSSKMPLSDAMLKVFPQYSWLAKLIGIAILTAFCGVLQSLSYSVSVLTHSFFKLLKNEYAQEFVLHKYSFEITVILIGFLILLNYLAITSIGLFFNLASFFMTFAFGFSILTLLIKKQDKTLGQKLLTFSALITIAIILIICLYGIVGELTNVF